MKHPQNTPKTPWIEILKTQLNHSLIFWEDASTDTNGQGINVCVHIFLQSAHLCLVRQCVYTDPHEKSSLLNLSLKFHEDPSFCYGDICKIMLNFFNH